MFRTEIDLIEIEGDPALRSTLESLEARVNRFPVGQSRHWVEIFSRDQVAPYLVINAHGGEHGLEIPELARSLQADQPISGPIGPAQIRVSGRAHGATIISLACASGSEPMAASWLEIGASAYIAPTDYPDADDALVFAINLFWQLLARGSSLADAFVFASGIGGDAGMFKLWTDAETTELTGAALASSCGAR